MHLVNIHVKHRNAHCEYARHRVRITRPRFCGGKAKARHEGGGARRSEWMCRGLRRGCAETRRVPWRCGGSASGDGYGAEGHGLRPYP